MNALIDSSALIWAERGPGAAGVDELRFRIAAGEIGLCAPVELEVLRGVGTPAAHAELADRLCGFPHVHVGEAVFARALAIQRELAALPGPRHRSVAPTDLLVAAAAIESELPLLHRDRDFEAIAEVTGQPQRWVGPRA
ncbi:MAG: PIN domain-containing protein [Actinomycetota bacterium]